jgi:hypothetical protein
MYSSSSLECSGERRNVGYENVCVVAPQRKGKKKVSRGAGTHLDVVYAWPLVEACSVGRSVLDRVVVDRHDRS